MVFTLTSQDDFKKVCHFSMPLVGIFFFFQTMIMEDDDDDEADAYKGDVGADKLSSNF